MNGAPSASRFFSAESATVQLQAGIVHQAFAFVAKVLPMAILTIDMDHGLDGSKFAGEAGTDFVRRAGHFQSDSVLHLCSCVHLAVRI
jgi:hypothetical protein